MRLIESLTQPVELLSDTIVYGHFYPVKYLGAAPIERFGQRLRLVTILRDPINRLRSHYNFWRAGTFSDHYLWRKMHGLDWSFTDFAFSREMKNYYNQYLFQTPLAMFSYIGLFEHMERSIHGCLDALEVDYDRNFSIPELSSTSAGARTVVSESTRTELMDYHAEDYALYEYARRSLGPKSSQMRKESGTDVAPETGGATG